MICPECGKALEFECKFCQFCGAKIDNFTAESNPFSQEYAAPAAEPIEETVFVGQEPVYEAPQPVFEQPPQYVEQAAEPVSYEEPPAVEKKTKKEKPVKLCRHCGGVIDPETKHCSNCGSKASGSKAVVIIILLCVLVIALCGLVVLQHLHYQDEIAAIEDTVAGLNTSVSGKDKEIQNLDDSLESLKEEIESTNQAYADLETEYEALQTDYSDLRKDYDRLSEDHDNLVDEKYELADKAAILDKIDSYLSVNDAHYAASNFHASEGLIFVSLGETTTFSLTANWPSGGTVDLAQDTSYADLSYGANSWSSSVSMTVTPNAVGATLFTFSNNIDSNKVKVLVVVTE